MKLVGLISGGKDSIYNMLQCIAAGHDIVAVANIEPETKGELDSYMYQSVGHEAIALIGKALGVTLFQNTTKGVAKCKTKTYVGTSQDEVEDLFELLLKVKDNTNIEGVSVGAILSDYQRTRVENICSRLGLQCFAYLWKRDQDVLLQEMIDAQINAIIIKVACLGLKPNVHLGMSINKIQPYLIELFKKYGVNVCGEGGEYETLTLDCPLFQSCLEINESEKIILSTDDFAPVGYLKVKNAELKSKIQDDLEDKKSVIKSLVKDPNYYVSEFQKDENFNLKNRESTEKRTMLTGISSPNKNEHSLSFKASPSCLVDQSSGWFCIGNIAVSDVEDAMESLKEFLENSQYTFKDVVFVNLFVGDMSKFISLNKAYSSYMPDVLPPARACVATSLPPDVNFIMTVIAHKVEQNQKSLSDENLSEKEVLHVQSISHWAPANIGPYSQCVKIDSVCYLAGQIPLVPGSMEMLSQPAAQQCLLTFRHIDRILKAMDEKLCLANVFQAVCYVTSRDIVSEMLSLWNQPHTVTAVIVVTELPKNAPLEWEVLASTLSCPQVDEDHHSFGSFVLSMKRCRYADSVVSSSVCHIRFSNQYKGNHFNSVTSEELSELLNYFYRFLKAGKDLEMAMLYLKIFYQFDSPVSTVVCEVVNDFFGRSKVVASAIPVVACEDPEVFVTIVGTGH